MQLEQTQKLIMTPELRQAIEILQMSSLDLTAYVNEALADNPLLESMEFETEDNLYRKKRNEVEWEDYIEKMREDVPERGMPREVRKEVLYESMSVRDVSLREHLLDQLGCLVLSPSRYYIGKYLVHNIDSAGYLTVSVEQGAWDIRTSPEAVREVLSVVQSLDPPGVGARDLRECLLIQLRQKNMDPSKKKALRRLIQDYLTDLGAGKINRVAQGMGATLQEVQTLADWIKQLNPKPGASFSDGEIIQYIHPDILMQKYNGEYQIIMNDHSMPRLMVNQTYREMLSRDMETDPKVRSFVETKLNQASWLIKCVEQRKATIYKVAEALLERQRDFFDRGVSALRPLTLKDIAADIGVHESTVSRATTNKYVQTPHGIFDFKFFFVSGIQTQDGSQASAETVKIQLKSLIKSENTRKPYSDQQLTEMMEKQGVRIARRTVSKYREEMGIPSTPLRRRFDG
jgi:RNA polymerase sigma-54 factor